MQFSSGQKIKQVNLIRYECLKLLYHCLVLYQSSFNNYSLVVNNKPPPLNEKKETTNKN